MRTGVSHFKRILPMLWELWCADLRTAIGDVIIIQHSHGSASAIRPAASVNCRARFECWTCRSSRILRHCAVAPAPRLIGWRMEFISRRQRQRQRGCSTT